MDFNIKTGQPEKLRTDCLILPLFESSKLPESTAQVDKISKGHISALRKIGDLNGKFGQTMLLHKVPGVASPRVLVVGCGKEGDFTDKAYRELIAKCANFLESLSIKNAASCLTELHVNKRDTAWKIQQAIITTLNTLYKFEEFKSGKGKTKSTREINNITWLIANKRDQVAAERSIAIGLAISDGMRLTRDLANTPANICNPEYLAKTAIKLGKTYKSVSTAVLDRKDMQALGMGALLAVGQGSLTPPKLITLEYRGANKSEAPIVLVGKGITFDSGGNSLKLAANMIGMKFDMSGAAAVLGLIKFAAQAKLPLNIVGVIAAAENMPGAAATRPDDIVTTMSGLTVEILNTDAEGRLVLCDALAYCERFKPAVVIDIATLTASCVMALGTHFSGLFSNHQPLADALLSAGNISGDRCWQLPLAEEYVKALESSAADLANVAGPEGGVCIAAGFLSKFTRQYKWAHLDVAGTACRWTGKDRGATGQPIPLIAEYLLQQAG